MNQHLLVGYSYLEEKGQSYLHGEMMQCLIPLKDPYVWAQAAQDVQRVSCH